MLKGINNAVSFGCTLAPLPKVHQDNIPFEKAQSKDDWVSGYKAAVEQFSDFVSLQNKIAHSLAYEGVLYTKKEDFELTPTPSPFSLQAIPTPTPTPYSSEDVTLSPFNEYL